MAQAEHVKLVFSNKIFISKKHGLIHVKLCTPNQIGDWGMSQDVKPSGAAGPT
jgi:hypothetical protein